MLDNQRDVARKGSFIAAQSCTYFSNLRKSLVLASDPSLQERARAARATDRSDNGCSNQSTGNLFILTLDSYIS